MHLLHPFLYASGAVKFVAILLVALLSSVPHVTEELARSRHKARSLPTALAEIQVSNSSLALDNPHLRHDTYAE